MKKVHGMMLLSSCGVMAMQHVIVIVPMFLLRQAER